MRNCASSVAEALALNRAFHAGPHVTTSSFAALAGKLAAEATETGRANAEDEI